jgi:hypothetical protein
MKRIYALLFLLVAFSATVSLAHTTTLPIILKENGR